MLKTILLQSSPRKNSKNGSSQGNSLPSNSPPRTPIFRTNSFSQPLVTQTSSAITPGPIIIKASKCKVHSYLNLKSLHIRPSHQAFSKKGGVQVSCGRPILGENDAKCTKVLTNLWRDMPPGRPLFKFWLKACVTLPCQPTPFCCHFCHIPVRPPCIVSLFLNSASLRRLRSPKFHSYSSVIIAWLFRAVTCDQALGLFYSR